MTQLEGKIGVLGHKFERFKVVELSLSKLLRFLEHMTCLNMDARQFRLNTKRLFVERSRIAIQLIFACGIRTHDELLRKSAPRILNDQVCVFQNLSFLAIFSEAYGRGDKLRLHHAT